MRRNKDHRVLALKDFQEKDYEDVLQRSLFCAKQGHTEEELKFFCKNCETAVCQTCVTLGHKIHEMNLIHDEAETQRIQMKSMIEALKNNLKAKKSLIRQLDEDYAKLRQQGEDVTTDVQNIVDKLVAVIEAKKQNILSAVESQTTKSLESLTKRKNKIEEQIAVIESSLEKAEKRLTRSINAEVVQLKKSLKSIFQGVDQAEPIDSDPEGLLVRLTFVENQKLLNLVNTEELGSLKMPYQTKASQSIVEGIVLKEATVGGETQFLLTTRSAQGRRGYNKDDRVTVEIRDEQGRKCAPKVQISDNKDGSYRFSYSPKEQGRHNVTVKVNGRHVLGSPFTVKVQPFQVKAVLSFGTKGPYDGMFSYPWGVAVNGRDEIAVTDHENNRVQIFFSDGNLLRSLGSIGRKGNKNGEFNCPTGIAFHKNGKIFVVDRDNFRIQIFNWEGEYLRSFGGKGSLDSQFSDPCGLSVDSDGNIIVADAGNKLIKIFSPDGKFLMKIGGQGSFTYPFLCVQCDRYLIVSDYGEQCMKVYDRDGKFQYKFGKKGFGDGEFNDPRCLSVNKSGQLMVCDTGNSRMQIFELNGKFVGKFGTEGSNIGEFKSPWSVAVLSNGRIVVSDIRTHRIQIFKFSNL